MDYWVRNRAKGIAIYKRDRKAGTTEVLKHPTIDTINKQFQSGAITRETAWKMAQELIATLKPKKLRLFNSENQKLFEQYWEEIYEVKENKDQVSARNRLLRGLNAVGPLSLHVAEKAALIRQLKAAEDKAKTQGKSFNRKEATAVVNQFLSYLGRPFKLPAVRTRKPKVSYLTWEQFMSMLLYIEDPTERLLYRVLFCTGARVGEAFALNKVINNKIVYIEEQITKSKQPDDLKTGEGGIRYAPILPQGITSVREWIDLDEDEKLRIRNVRFGDNLRAACIAAKVSVITARDLRHCYAISLANAGAPIGLIARALGNSEGVCNRYYTGFVLTEPGTEALANLLYNK